MNADKFNDTIVHIIKTGKIPDKLTQEEIFIITNLYKKKYSIDDEIVSILLQKYTDNYHPKTLKYLMNIINDTSI